MERSENIEELAQALAQAQGEFRPAQKSGKNPHLRNRYATLDDIIEAVRGPLQDHGLSFLQLLDGPDLTTMLLHESGQWVSARATIESLEGNRGTNDMQAFGATLTYLKRYALAAMLGISSDEDVDGEVKRPTQKKAKPKEKAHWIDNDATRKRFWVWTKEELALSEDQVYEALGVDSIHKFDGSAADAKSKIEAWTSRQNDEPKQESERLGIDVRARK